MNNVLIIEDDFNLRENIFSLLTEYGYTVYEAGNGKDGVEIAKKYDIDVIICDYFMKDINGLEVKSEIEKLNNHSKISFILMTGAQEIMQFSENMDIKIIIKPFKIDALLKIVNEANHL